MNIVVGASASAASKSLSCFGSNGSYKCVVAGMGSGRIANGVVARATLTLASGTTASRPVQVTGPMAAALAGTPITSTGAGGAVSLPGPVPDTQPPSAPGLLSASATGSTQINLSWTASTDNVGVTGYRVERCQGAGCSNFSQIATLAAGAVSYSNTGLENGTSYSYRVRATDAASNLSSFSNVATASTLSAVSGKVLGYGFSEGTGPAAADASGSGITGTLQNAAWTASGKFDKALTFNGSNAFVELGNPNALRFTGSMTLSAWVYPTGNPWDDGQIIAKSGDRDGWQLKTTPDTGVRTFGIAISNGSAHIHRFSSRTVTLNRWYHVAGVYNAAARTLDIYVDGVLDNGILSGTVPSAQNNSAVNVNVGRRSGGFYFIGTIDEVRAYSRPLSAAEIQADMGTPVTPGAPAPAVQLSTLSCAPASLASGQAANCTVALTGAAPAGGAAVSVSDNNASLTVPASVTVAAGATTAGFTATAGSIASNQTAVITAAYGGVSRTSSISLMGTTAPAQVSTLSCTPASLSSAQAAACTVTLNKAAPSGGAAVALSDNSALLSIPASVTVAAGATSGSFTATAGTISSDSTVTVTASYSGSSKSAAIGLRAPAGPVSIWSSSATPATVQAGSTASTEVGLKFRSTAAGYITGVRFYKGPQNTGSHTGRLWSSTGSLLAAVAFMNETASGWQQALFPSPVRIEANRTYIVSYGASRGRHAADNNYFAASGVTNGPLTALKNGTDGGNGVFQYPAGRFPNRSSQSSNYWVDVLFSAQAPAPLSSEPSENIPTTQDSAQESGTISRAITEQRPAAERRPAALSCSPRIVRAGEPFRCILNVGDGSFPDMTAIPVDASGTDVRLPVHLSARAGQQSLTFHGSVDKGAPQSLVLIRAGEGDLAAEDQITVLAANAPVLGLPDVLYARPGEPVSFTVAAQDGSYGPVTVTAASLPANATFDPEAKQFAWTPGSNQEGEHTIGFKAVGLGGTAISEKTRIVVAVEKPQATGPAACITGSPATLQGRWLSQADETVADRTGSSLELGGTAVRANGTQLPVLSASPTRVEFLCPDQPAGQAIDVVLETAMGASAPVRMAIAEAKPVLLSTEGSESEGFIQVADTNRLAVVRDVRGSGEPALREDLVVIHATGLGSMTAEPASLSVRFGSIETRVESVSADPAAAGVFRILVRVPSAVDTGDAIPVQMILRSPTGQLLTSNTVTMAVE